jgi:group I intron endonuclease
MIKLDLGAGAISPDGYIPMGRDYGSEIFPLAYPDESVDREYGTVSGMVEFGLLPHSLPKIQGIYVITNNVTGMRYVGSSHDVRARTIGHRNKLVRQKHANRYLQAAWNVSGATAFSWGVLEAVQDASQLATREAHYIGLLASGHDRSGYNLVLNPCTGTLAPDVRARMSAARKGMTAWNKGVPCPEHVKQAITDRLTGRVKGVEEVAKIRAAMLGPAHPHRGKKLPDAIRAKLSKRLRSAPALGDGFKGVNRDSRTGTFMARIYSNGRQIFLGRYATDIDAARAYNLAAIEHFGDGCFLNDVPVGLPSRRTLRGRPAKEAHHG